MLEGIELPRIRVRTVAAKLVHQGQPVCTVLEELEGETRGGSHTSPGDIALRSYWVCFSCIDLCSLKLEIHLKIDGKAPGT